ncbi:P-loop ATPase, Sll1717 family [Hydrogenophaga luteola]|uniref:P-loop ATPase, Sll1717 family n=1 Tax=Hydrogenophaga luteola TaxID=1591122 RepID=A0ABV7W8A6_9BURK
MKTISQLEFGFIDAQRYLQNPGDPLSEFFRKSFYKSKHLERAIDPDVYFLLGEKGTGKTAYAVYASLYMGSSFVADTEFFDKNDFTRFREVASSLGIEASQYSSLWVFTFIILLINNIDERTSLTKNPTLSHFMGAIRTISLGGQVRTISQSIEIASQIDSLFDKFASSANLGLPESVVSSAKPIFKITRLSDLCVAALADYSNALQFAMFIDGLDVRPDEVSYHDYLTVVSSICNAIWVINSTQLARIEPQIKITLLLRPDILETVPFQNRGPMLQNHSHLVEWGTRYPNFADSEIFKFTDRVLYSQQDEAERLYPGQTWEKYFPFKVESRASASGDNPFILFLRHSFYKPRDILKYLGLMKDFYETTGRGGVMQFEADVFKDRDIGDSYSRYLMLEIRDQLSFYYTNEEYQQFLDFTNGFLGKYIDKRDRVFTYENFCKAHLDYLEYNSRNKKVTVPSFATADITLQFMFDLNVLGYYEEKVFRNGEAKVFTNYSFRKRSFANLRPKVPTSGRYVMHYGVAKSLLVDFR